MTDHLTIGELRALLARHADKPDSHEVRIYLDHGHAWDDTFGHLSATLDSPEEDGTPAYIGLRITDTGDLR